MPIDPRTVKWDLPDPAAVQWDDEPAKKPTKPEPTFAQKAVDFVRPTVEALGAIGGGALGLAAPVPGGTIIGSGLGYGIAKGGLRLVDEYLGTEKPPQNAFEAIKTGTEDMAMGAIMERGGQIAAPYISRGVGWLGDAFYGGKARAAKIAKEALGPDVVLAKNALRSAPVEETAAQATANINAPTWQALNKRVAARDPKFYGIDELTPEQEANALFSLEGLAGGKSQTAAIATRDAGKEAARSVYKPKLDIELEAANTAGRLKPKYEGEAARMADAAAAKVEDVRRFTAAGERAGERAATTTSVPGMPNTPGRYTHMGDLGKKAEEVAQQAADASLPFGDAARFNKAIADSLEPYGLRPLTPDNVMASIRLTLKNPKFAGNTELEAVMLDVGQTISKWTKNGVIQAEALDSIRRNAVNDAVNRLSKGMDPAANKKLAADVSRRLSPMIEDAIENAGGTGYKKIIKEFADARQLIDQQKLSAKALDLFRTNKKQFVELVEGNSPEEVSKIFGLSKDGYDIAKQMSAEAMTTLKGTADLTKRGSEAAKQAQAGQEALKKVINDNITRLKIPWGLSPGTMATNRALDILEHRAGTKTMNILAEAMKSGKSADDLLSYLPAKERVNLLRVLNDPTTWKPGISAASVNALTPDTR